MNNIHYLIIGLALLYSIIAIIRPAVWPLPVAVILIAIDLFSRMSKTLIALLALSACLLATPAHAQTNTGNWLTILAGDVKTFFTDQTNLFNQGTVALEAGPVVNVSNWRVGADVDVQFPIAQQASVGFDVLYYNGEVYDGTFNTTLGTTWQVPVIGPVYTYGQAGVGTDLQNRSALINEEWAGARVKWKLTGNIFTAADVLNFGVNAAAGRISNENGTLGKVMVGLEYHW